MPKEIKEGLSPTKYYNLARGEAEITQKIRDEHWLLHWAKFLSKHTEYLTETDQRTVASVTGMIAIVFALRIWSHGWISFAGSEGLAIGGAALAGASLHPISWGIEKSGKLVDKFSETASPTDDKRIFKGKTDVEDVADKLRKFSDVVPPGEIRDWTRGKLSQPYEEDSRIEIVKELFRINLDQKDPLSPNKEISARRRTVEKVMEAQVLAQIERRSKKELARAALKESIDILGTVFIIGGIGTAINIMTKQYALVAGFGFLDDFLCATPIIFRIAKKSISKVGESVIKGVKSLSSKSGGNN